MHYFTVKVTFYSENVPKLHISKFDSLTHVMLRETTAKDSDSSNTHDTHTNVSTIDYL
jgi:hypothetical protein